MAVTSDRFLSGLKRRIVLPASQPLMSDDDLFEMADDTVKAKLIPLIKSINQDFFVTTSETAFVEDQKDYAIPYRAMGRTLRDLKLIDPSDNRRNLALIALEDEHLYVSGTIAECFFFKGDKVSIVPTPIDDTYSLEFWWELPPAKLIPLSEAAVVVSTTTTTVVVASAPTGITTNAVIDFVAAQSGCATIDFDKTVTGISGTTYTFASGDIPDSLAAGDYICLAGFAPVLQIPDEAHSYLETCTARRVLTAIGDYEGAKELKEAEDDEKKNLLMILEPRVEGECIKIINRKGLLRAYRGRFLSSRAFY